MMKVEKRKKVGLFIYIFILIVTFVLMVIGFVFKFNKPYTTPQCSLTKMVGVVKEDVSISQKFEVEVDSLNSIDIIYADFGIHSTGGNMRVEIYDDEELIYLDDLDMPNLQDNQKLSFVFKPIKDSYGKVLELRITLEDLPEDDYFTFYANDVSKDYEISIAEKGKDLDLYGSINIIQHGIKKGYFYMVVLFVIFLIEVFIGSFKYIKPKEISTKKMVIGSIISVIISCVMSVTLILTFYGIVVLEKVNWWIFMLLFFTSSIEMLFIGVMTANRKENVSKLFLSLAIPLGALFFVCMVPGSVPDENFHAVMTYELASGQVLQKDVDYIKELEIDYKKYSKTYDGLTNKNREIGKYKRNGGYWLVMYIGGAVGMFVGNLFKLPVLTTMYLGSFVNYILFLIVGYFVIKKLPFGKYLALAYMLSPMYLQQATSLSCDAFINSVAMLYIAILLNVKFSKEEMSRKDMVLLFIFAGSLCMCKTAYAPMVALLLLIKDKIIKCFKKYKKETLICLLSVVIFIVGSYILISKVSLIGKEVDVLASTKPQGSINKLQYVMADPLVNIPYLILNTLHCHTNMYVYQFSGMSLNWLRINGPYYFEVIFIVILILSALFEEHKYKFSNSDKKIIIFTWLINTCLVFLGIYLGWGYQNDLLVNGVQGRYFIPLVILLLLLLASSSKKVDFKNKNLSIVISLLFINIYMISYVLQYYL